KPASGIGAAPRAAEHNIIGLVDRLMDKNRQAEPWMPPIQKLAKAGPVGVIKLRCTTTSEHIGRWIKMRRSLARFSGLESSVHTRYSADFIITTSAFRFSVHTGTSQTNRRVITRRRICLPAHGKSATCLIPPLENRKLGRKFIRCESDPKFDP